MARGLQTKGDSNMNILKLDFLNIHVISKPVHGITYHHILTNLTTAVISRTRYFELLAMLS